VAEPIDLVPLPGTGRRFTATRSVRLGDTTPGGRVRLDAVARYLQDVADDDATGSGLGPGLHWVVRRTVVEVARFPVLRERLHLVTACTGTGARWAERRTSIEGERGGRVEAVSLWVLLEAGTGRPRRLPEEFVEIYGPSAAGRVVSARLAHGDPAPGRGPGRAFPLRASDLDVAGHVNNAVYWAMLEEHLRGAGRALPLRAEVEHRQALEPGATPVLVDEGSAVEGPGLRLWALDAPQGSVAASAVAATSRSAPPAGPTTSEGASSSASAEVSDSTW
jgi:acyl-ACP thioesterase